jgi:polysaccharide chain length determinant protein (PEP-CTERM system associated)
MDKKQKKLILRYIDLVIKKRWFLIIPVCLSLAAGIYLSITLPRTYQAMTLILVESSKVPSSVVKPIQSEDIRDKINTISEQIMSQTYLDRIMQQYNLFSGPEHEKMFPEDKYRAMRKNIEIDLSRSRGGIDAFKLSYKGGDPEKVKNVANALAKFFIDQSLEVLLGGAVGTRKFLEGELEGMKSQLEGHEKALSEYREKHMGRLPNQLNSNLQTLSRLQLGLDAKQESLRDARTRLADIEKRREEAEKMRQMMMSQMNQLWDDDGMDMFDSEIEEALSEDEIRLQKLREQHSQLLTRYTEKHPDVARLANHMRELEEKIKKNQQQQNRDRETENPPSEGTAPEKKDAAATLGMPGEMAMMPSLGDPLKEQYEATLREMRKYEKDILEITNQISDYERRVEETPRIESELQALTRDYNNIKSVYESLLARKLEASISESMERQSKGTRFQILDYAKTPQKPVSPDEKKLFLLFAAAGFGIGGGIIFLFGFLDGAVRDPDEIEAISGDTTEIVVIPKIYTPRQKMFRYANWSLSLISMSIAMALFLGFALLTMKGFDQTVAMLRNYVNIPI